MTEKQKPRVRFSKGGWYLCWGSYMAGYVEAMTGRIIPDRWGNTGEVKMWVGPFRTAPEALLSRAGR